MKPFISKCFSNKLFVEVIAALTKLIRERFTVDEEAFGRLTEETDSETLAHRTKTKGRINLTE